MKKLHLFIALAMIVTLLTMSACGSSPTPTGSTEESESVITIESEVPTNATEEPTTKEPTTEEPTTKEPTTEEPKKVLNNVLVQINLKETHSTAPDNFGQKNESVDDNVLLLDYDSEGTLIGISAHDRGDIGKMAEAIGDILWDKVTAKYENGKLIEIQCSTGGEETGKSIYEYDEQGKLVKITTYGRVGGYGHVDGIKIMSFEINEIYSSYYEFVTLGTARGSEQKITSTKDFSYNSDGTIAQIVCIRSDSTSTTTYVYENGHLINDGKFYDFVYDDKLRVIEKRSEEWKYLYTYNENDLVTKYTCEKIEGINKGEMSSYEFEYVYGDYEIKE